MPRARTATKTAPPAPKVYDTGVDPLATFLTGAPGNVSRFACTIGASKPVTFATRTGVEVWITAAGA